MAGPLETHFPSLVLSPTLDLSAEGRLLQRRKQNVMKVHRAAKEHRLGDRVSTHRCAEAQGFCSVQINLREDQLKRPLPDKIQQDTRL